MSNYQIHRRSSSSCRAYTTVAVLLALLAILALGPNDCTAVYLVELVDADTLALGLDGYGNVVRVETEAERTTFDLSTNNDGTVSLFSQGGGILTYNTRTRELSVSDGPSMSELVSRFQRLGFGGDDPDFTLGHGGRDLGYMVEH